MDSKAVAPEMPHHPEEAPGRPAWEVAALFLAITLGLFLWWRLQQTGDSERAAALSQTLRAERSVQLTLAMPGAAPKDRWRAARQEYQRALKIDPRLPRALRGLAALEFMDGNHAEAARVMKRPSDTPEEMRPVWQAFRVAFGAAPKPKGAALQAHREALERKNLGWSRLVALKALAATPEEAERWDAALRRGGGDGGPGKVPIRLSLVLIALLALPVGLWKLVGYLSQPPPSRLGPLHAPPGALLTVAAVSVLVAQAPVAFIRFVLAPHEAEPSRVAWFAAMALGAALGVAVMFPTADRLLRRAGSSLREIGWSRQGLLRWSVGGYLAMLPLLFAGAIASAALDRLFPNIPTPDNPAAGMAAASGGLGFLALLLFAAVVAPVLEEFVMRGLLFRALAKRYGMGVGMVASSFIFSGLHPQLPAGFPPLFVIGIGLCAVYRASGSLLPAIAIHAVSNAVVLSIARTAFS